MAFRRALSNKATIFPPTFNPSFTQISHLHHDNVNQHPNHQDFPSSGSPIHTYLTQLRSFGSCTSYNNPSCQLVGAFRRTGYGCVGNGLVLNRYMSTSIGEEEETSFPNEVPMELLSDDVSTVMAGASPVEGVSEVAIAAADSLFPVAAVQHLIDGVHSFTGLNWWLSISVAILLIRGATLPLAINLHKENFKFGLVMAKKKEIEDQLKAKFGSHVENLHAIDLTSATEAFEKIDQLYKEYGVTAFTPYKQLCLHLPIMISFVFALCNMAEKVPSFKTGGALWFADLTTPDAMYILPSLLALILIIQPRGLKEKPLMINKGKVFTAGLLTVILISIDIQTAFYFYWLPDRLFRLGYAVVHKDPRVWKALDYPSKSVLPPSTPSADDSESPKDK